MVKEAALPDPTCQGSMLSTVFNGREYLLHSNCSNASGRTKMTIKTSADGGKSWSSGYLVWGGYTAYSDMVMLDDKIIGILYENGDAGSYERISFEKAALSYIWK